MEQLHVALPTCCDARFFGKRGIPIIFFGKLKSTFLAYTLQKYG
jgi:hypothetical protein